ncbi:MAG: DUF3592 domain-containing protein [Streptosporangiales bacterium]|nr:DUF3592 domain-containing protein [Streptosporangiales bacterium]
MDALDLDLFVPGMFVLVGSIFVVSGIRSTATWLSFRKRAVRCVGLVTDVRAEWNSGNSDRSGHYIYYPVLAFQTNDGKEVQTVAGNGMSPPRYHAGQQVTVTYDAADPLQAYAGKGTSVGVMTVVFMLAGAVAATFGVSMLIGNGALADLIGRL